MRGRISALAAGLVAASSIVLLAPIGSAHPFGLPIVPPNGHYRCYYFDYHETNERSFWIETNGILTGGEKQAQEWFGVPAGGSGLQRFTDPGTDGELGTGDDIPGDTEVSLGEWRDLCVLGIL